MNRDDIIRMAKEAEAEFAELPRSDAIVFHCDDVYWNSLALERFANLVAAAEREACAKVCDSAGPGWPVYCAFAIRERGAP